MREAKREGKKRLSRADLLSSCGPVAAAPELLEACGRAPDVRVNAGQQSNSCGTHHCNLGMPLQGEVQGIHGSARVSFVKFEEER